MTGRGALPAVLAALLAAACGRDPIGMLRQPRGKPFRGTAAFADGRMMRTPPPGTVPRGGPDLPDRVRTGEDGGRPVEEVPVPLSMPMLERGRHDFQIWCAACHGGLGDGRSVVATKMALRPPPSIVDHRRAPGDVFRTITEGYGLMPSYAEDLDVEARWGVVAYLEALRRSRAVPLSALPPDVRRMLEEAP